MPSSRTQSSTSKASVTMMPETTAATGTSSSSASSAVSTRTYTTTGSKAVVSPVPVRSSSRKKNVTSTVFFDCDQCQERFYSPTTLLKHHQSVHNRVRVKSQKSPSSLLSPSGGQGSNASLGKGQYFSPNDPKDVAFFSSVSQNIAENLVFHVDGRVGPTVAQGKDQRKNLRTATVTFSSPSTTTGTSSSTSTPALDLSFYNFPKSNTTKSETSMSEDPIEEAKRGFMRESFSLKRALPLPGVEKTDPQDPPSKQQVIEQREEVHDPDQPYDLSMPSKRSDQSSKQRDSCLPKPTLESKGKITKREYQYICTVCGNRSLNRLSFFDHAKNNHPNATYSYIVTDASNTIPTHLLIWRYNNPFGLLKSCDVSFYPLESEKQDDSKETVASDKTVKCTACSTSFASRSLLRGHVFDCAKKTRKEQKSQSQISMKSNRPSVHSDLFSVEDMDDSSYTTRSGKKRSRDDVSVPSSSQSSFLEKKSTDDKKKIRKKRKSLEEGVTVSSGKETSVISHVTLTEPAVEAAMKALSPNLNKKTVEDESAVTSKETVNGSDSTPKINKLFIKRSLNKKYGKKFTFKSSLRKHSQSSSNAAGSGSKIVLRQRFRSIQPNSLKVLEDPDKTPKPTTDETSTVTSEEQKEADDKTKGVKKSVKVDTKPATRTATPQTEVRRTRNSLRNKLKEEEKQPKEVEDNKDNDDSEKKNDEPTKSNKIEEAVDETTSINEDSRSEGMNESDTEKKPDVWQIKQDHPLFAFKGSPAQHHSCPYCQRGFTYLANFRKHIKAICPIRQQMEEKKKIQQKLGEGTSMASTSTSGEASSCINSNNSFNLSSDGTKSKFKTYTCNICHKIYFSYLEKMKHQLSHKLTNSVDDSSTVKSASENVSSDSACNSRKVSTDSDELLSLEEQAAREALAQTHVGDRRKRRSSSTTITNKSSPSSVTESQKKLTQFRTRLQSRNQSQSTAAATSSTTTRAGTSKTSSHELSAESVPSLLESLARGGVNVKGENNDDDDDDVLEADSFLEGQPLAVPVDPASQQETFDEIIDESVMKEVQDEICSLTTSHNEKDLQDEVVYDQLQSNADEVHLVDVSNDALLLKTEEVDENDDQENDSGQDVINEEDAFQEEGMPGVSSLPPPPAVTVKSEPVESIDISDPDDKLETEVVSVTVPTDNAVVDNTCQPQESSDLMSVEDLLTNQEGNDTNNEDDQQDKEKKKADKEGHEGECNTSSLQPKSIPVTLTDSQQTARSMAEQLFHGLGNC